MARNNVVVGGDFLHAAVTKAAFGSDLVVQAGFKQRKLNPTHVTEWEEVIQTAPSTSTVSAVGQAVAGTVLPGFISKSASAALGAAIDSKTRHPHTIRIEWADGKRSLLRLSDEFFVHLELVLRKQRVESTPIEETEPSPPSPTVTEQAFGLVSGLLKDRGQTPPPAAPAPDITQQLTSLASLHAAGVLTDEEFAAKKAELLARM